jgi:hypothetical protein
VDELSIRLDFVEAKRATIERMLPILAQPAQVVKRLGGETIQDKAAESNFQTRRLEVLSWAKGDLEAKKAAKDTAKAKHQAATSKAIGKQAEALERGTDLQEEDFAEVDAAELQAQAADADLLKEDAKMEAKIRAKIKELGKQLTKEEVLHICGDLRGMAPETIEAIAHIEDLMIALGMHPAVEPDMDLYAALQDLELV